MALVNEPQNLENTLWGAIRELEQSSWGISDSIFGEKPKPEDKAEVPGDIISRAIEKIHEINKRLLESLSKIQSLGR